MSNKKCVFCHREVEEEDREYPVCDQCMNIPYLEVVRRLKNE